MKRLKNIFGDNYTIKNVVKKGKCLIACVDDKYISIKEKNNHNIKDTYDYLLSRGFEYYPKTIINNDRYNIYEYVEEINSPIEQKAFDMMLLLSLLHNKTTFYKEMDINEYKEIYESNIDKINNTRNYYDNIMNNVESHVYMSPSEYLLARNIAKIYGALEYAKRNIEVWYDLVKKVAKKRMVLLYNNMDINHVIKNEKLYLINWDKSKLGMPLYDVYNFYIKYALNFDFKDLIKYYESKYPLLKEEKILLNVLISIPDIPNINSNEVENCKELKNIIDILYKSETLISENTAETDTE